jgi:hypothetical protein
MAENKEKRDRVNQKEITLIKTMLEAGISANKVKDITGRSATVVKTVELSDGSIEDYKRINLERYKERLELEGKLNSPSDEPIKIENPVEGKSERINHEYLNDLTVIAQRLDHIESMMVEHLDNHQAELTLLKSKKFIF